MITLIYPTEHEQSWISYNGFLYGPVGPGASYLGQVIPVQPWGDAITQGAQFYGENNVIHWEHKGTVRYDPVFQNYLPAPTSAYPDQVIIPYWGTGGGSITANKGFALDRSVCLESTATNYFQTLTERVSSNVWRHHTIGIRKYDLSHLAYYDAVEMTLLELLANGSARFSRSSYRYGRTPMVVTTVDWSVKQTPEVVLAACQSCATWPAVGGSKTGGVSTVTGPWKDLSNGVTQTPAKVIEMLNSQLEELEVARRQLELWDFGELAMQASEKVNATHINMLAFIRDLRDVKSLIPKLANLKTLKGIAGTYLGTIYGIMPTISDLKEIGKAFERAKPFHDKNGFTTYGGFHSDSKTFGDISATLEQRIKLAIANEDDGFDKLLERFESVGMLPTTEFVWDLLPYTFVIDWFVDVGGFLERVDTRLRLLRLNIRYVTMSTKTVVKQTIVPSFTTPFIGELESVQYHRWTSDQCPVPPLFPKFHPTISNHWLEAGALLLQRTKTTR